MNVAECFWILSLASPGKVSDSMFFYNLCNDFVVTPAVLEMIALDFLPKRTRHKGAFTVNLSKM